MKKNHAALQGAVKIAQDAVRREFDSAMGQAKRRQVEGWLAREPRSDVRPDFDHLAGSALNALATLPALTASDPHYARNYLDRLRNEEVEPGRPDRAFEKQLLIAGLEAFKAELRSAASTRLQDKGSSPRAR